MKHLIQFIKQIHGKDYGEGCGVLIKNYLITAGHVVIGRQEPYIYHDGKKYELTNPVFASVHNDSNKLDLAIYYLENIKSDISLSEGNPNDEETVTFMGYINQMSNPQFIMSKGKILEDLKEGNYYAIETEEQLKAGCSGSPIFQEEKLVGIIIRGNRDDYGNPLNPKFSTKLCMILSCEAITRILNTLKMGI